MSSKNYCQEIAFNIDVNNANENNITADFSENSMNIISTQTFQANESLKRKNDAKVHFILKFLNFALTF